MKKLLLPFLLIYSLNVCASGGESYLNRFMAYLDWSQHIPSNPSEEFFNFIDSDTPLAGKLREKWLHQVALQKNWQAFQSHYKTSSDISLQCYHILALYQEGKNLEAFNLTKPLWLYGDSRPKACDEVFNQLLKQGLLDETLIKSRFILALEKRNLPLARYLLKQFKPARIKEDASLTSIYQNPSRIIQLPKSDFQGELYLFGLTRLVTTNMDLSIKLWKFGVQKRILNEAQEQAFLSHLALYKAMRNHEDTEKWFNLIKSNYYNETLLDWQIRYSLKKQDWNQVSFLINHLKEKETPCWQYWLARAEEAKGNVNEARTIYQALAPTRNYYGFLASLRINKKPNFENEPPNNNPTLLKAYQPFTANVKSLYSTKQTLQASRLLNDFILELPKEDKSALTYWVANDLQWHGKAVYLSNTEDLNNQLLLRFPLAYQQVIQENSKNYHISPEFIYAIIRQESAFREDVVSPAGALGLMQVMPNTAKIVAKVEKIGYLDKSQLFVFQKNITIGVAYLKQLAKRFNQHPILMAAAYNAGPRQVVYWMKNHPPKQMDIWIETLPWRETRNYLKNIMAFYAVYQYRMHSKPDLSPFFKPI